VAPGVSEPPNAAKALPPGSTSAVGTPVTAGKVIRESVCFATVVAPAAATPTGDGQPRSWHGFVPAFTNWSQPPSVPAAELVFTTEIWSWEVEQAGTTAPEPAGLWDDSLVPDGEDVVAAAFVWKGVPDGEMLGEGSLGLQAALMTLIATAKTRPQPAAHPVMGER
jgi:hypothetical protein